MDGLECVRHLRAHENQHPARPRVYAVAVSGNSDDPGVADQARAAVHTLPPQLTV
jgi:CheY-like chemotaxis protein